MSFAEFMDLALYHDKYGYYSSPGSRVIGRSGDFFTSVAVGGTFGLLLAHALVREVNTRPDREAPFVIVEQGAHDGRLARDIMAGLKEIDRALWERVEYRIIESRKPVREMLNQTLAEDPSAAQFRVVKSFVEARAPRGVFICNELLDAFPVHCLIYAGGRWQERCVGLDRAGIQLDWVSRPLPASLSEFADELGNEFPEGYCTEVCPAVDKWMMEAAQLFEEGLWWVIDYGYERADYYLEQRRTGTLRCYDGHRAGENPFISPGGQDITAHVDFTRLVLAAEREGLIRSQFTDQHHFLIEAARPWLLGMEGKVPDAVTAKRLRQFQTLTHPSLMGQQFKVMELRRRIQTASAAI